MTMKWIMTMALAATMAGSGYAQETKDRPTGTDEYAAQLTGRLTKELELTPQQAEQVREINAKYMEKMMALRAAEEGIDPKAEKQAMNDAMQNVLTPGQFAKLQRMQAVGARTPEGAEIKAVTPVK